MSRNQVSSNCALVPPCEEGAPALLVRKWRRLHRGVPSCCVETAPETDEPERGVFQLRIVPPCDAGPSSLGYELRNVHSGVVKASIPTYVNVHSLWAYPSGDVARG